jgi:hypothetical protein
MISVVQATIGVFKITGMKPQSPENSGETYSAADLPVRQAGLRGIKPSAFGGIVRLTNFNALRF